MSKQKFRVEVQSGLDTEWRLSNLCLPSGWCYAFAANALKVYLESHGDKVRLVPVDTAPKR
jgi:hypothetical protein